MEKLPMCRVCLVKNVRMYIVVNRSMHELYEKLTDIRFVTEDSRPILACFVCFAKLKQCCRLQRKCLESEQLFTQMMNEDYEPHPLINQDQEIYSGFIKSPIQHISIVDECQTESIAIKEEFPAVCEEHQSHELELENLDNSCLDIADIPPDYFESDSGDDVPLIEFKTEVEEEEVSEKKRRARETKRVSVAKKPKLDTRRTKLEDAITAEQTKKEKLDSNVIRTTQKRTSKPDTYFKVPAKCEQRSFNPVKNVIEHTLTQTGEKPYKCDVCQRSFSFNSNLVAHIRKHTGEKPYKCDVCPRSFSYKSSLVTHIRKHTGKKLYKCGVCQRSFSHKSDLTKHIRIHTGEKPHKCDVCQRSFRQKNHLTLHIRLHTGEKPYKCDICQRSFSRKIYLTNHIRIHTVEKRHKCDLCQSSFNRKCDLSQHIRIHTGEKPLKCDVCQRSFTQKIYLTNHIRLHTVEKRYKCDLCQSSFNRKYDLSQHIRIHTGEKPYKCDVCLLRFSGSSNLIKHIRKHTGEKSSLNNVSVFLV